ncbi:hypothetical protein FOXB_12037 [Fusarium oxysporum f. sp. conglutinans Fo5176]|uniref:Uncharacterized protein n=2 Tax=Fusarium oxysporum f. sp. conglutinans TaxID=100902 RepID=F9G055_FUSOF|nr:hypothetical protein FOXB_12037 [Fusarium oxysporum f. sp. conglutinans Fo5176]
MTSKKKGTARRTGPFLFSSRTRTTKDVPPIMKLLSELGFGDSADKALLNEFNTARKFHMNRFIEEKIIDDKDMLEWSSEPCKQKIRRMVKDFLVRQNHGPRFWPDEPSAANTKKYRYSQDSQQSLYNRRSHNIKVRKEKRRTNLFERGDAPDKPITLDLSSDESDYEYQVFDTPASPISGESSLKREPSDSPELSSLEEIRHTVQSQTMPSDTVTPLPNVVQDEHVNPEPAQESSQPSANKRKNSLEPLSQSEASPLRTKSPRLSGFRGPTADPFSRDANVRLESVARAVSPRQDLRRSSRKPVPVPVASMGEGSGTNDTQELSPEAERNTTDEIVCGFNTAIRVVPPIGEDSSTHMPGNVTERAATDQPVKLGSTPLSQKDTTATSGRDIEELSSISCDTAAARRLLSSHLRGHNTDTPTPLQFSFSFHDGSHGDPFNISAVEFFTMTLKQFMDVLPMNDKEMITGLCIRQYGPRFCLRQVYLYNEDVFGNIRQQFLRCIESDTRDVKNHGKRLDYEISIEPLRE